MSDFNPDLDLRFSRVVDVPRASVWRAWTEPDLLMPWFCPLPWKTIACEIDLRPGGLFRTTMQSPEGQAFDNATCGSDEVNFMFTATIQLSEVAEGTRYIASVKHADAHACKQHAAMGFEEG